MDICKKLWIFGQKYQNLSSKYSPKLLHDAKQSATDALKTASKRTIQQKAEATGDLTGNKIPKKIKLKIYQKKNLFGNTPDQLPKFRTKI